MSGLLLRMIVPAAGLSLLVAGCQPVQDAPLDLRAPVAPETAPDLNAYAEETLPALPDDTAAETPAVELAQVTIPPQPEEVTPPEPEQPVEPAPAPVPVPTPPAQLEPATLVGGASDQLLLRLGEPDYLRKEGQVEIWQYRFQSCVVNFIMLEGDGGPMITSWIGRHRQLGLAYDHDTCIRELGEREQL